MVSEVAKVGLRASSSQVTLVWWPGRWHIFELWGNCAFFVSPKRAGFGRSLGNGSCAISTAGQANEAWLWLLHSQRSVSGRGSVQVAWPLGERCPVRLCLCHSACARRGARRESLAPRSLCASPVRARCARGRRYVGPGGRSPLCAHPCPRTRCRGGGEEACTTCARLPCFLLALQHAGLSLCRKSP